jgi:DnaJ family protein B protein 12
MGAEALRSSNFPRAIKLLQKSLEMYPLPGVEAMLSQTKARMQESENTSSSSSQPSSNGSNGAPPPPQRASSTASVASSNTQMGKDGRAYTQDQVTIVNSVLKAKEGGRGAHYRVLGNISQDSNETQIKKAYRKLSLKVHPDKNSAPHADEAFKAVGLAYGVLSDPQKRTIYDRYGEEDPDNRGGGGGGGGGFGGMGRRAGGMHMHQGQDVSPEEIFNMFFGGGGIPGRGGGQGFHFSTNGFGNPGMRTQRPRGQPRQQQAQQEQQAPSMGMLFQFLPILLIMLVSFFKYDEGQGMASGTGGNMPGENRYFSLTVRLLSCLLVVPYSIFFPIDSFYFYFLFIGNGND